MNKGRITKINNTCNPCGACASSVGGLKSSASIFPYKKRCYHTSTTMRDTRLKHCLFPYSFSTHYFSIIHVTNFYLQSNTLIYLRYYSSTSDGWNNSFYSKNLENNLLNTHQVHSDYSLIRALNLDPSTIIPHDTVINNEMVKK